MKLFISEESVTAAALLPEPLQPLSSDQDTAVTAADLNTLLSQVCLVPSPTVVVHRQKHK